MSFYWLSPKSVFHDFLQANDRLVALLQNPREGLFDLGPSLFVGDIALANTPNKFRSDNIICIEKAEHLTNKGTTAFSKYMQPLGKAPKHSRRIDYAVGHQAAVFRPLQNSPECNHLIEQNKRDPFSLKSFFALAISPVGQSHAHRCRKDYEGPHSLNPCGGPRVALNPSEDRLRKLETFEHSPSLPRLPSFVERVAR